MFLKLINSFYWHIWIIFKWKGTIIFGHNLDDLTIMLSASAGPLGRIRYLIPDLPKLPIIHQSVSSKDLKCWFMNHFVLNTCNINYCKRGPRLWNLCFSPDLATNSQFCFYGFLYEFSTNIVFDLLTSILNYILVAVFFKTIWLVRIFMKVCKNWFEICY